MNFFCLVFFFYIIKSKSKQHKFKNNNRCEWHGNYDWKVSTVLFRGWDCTPSCVTHYVWCRWVYSYISQYIYIYYINILWFIIFFIYTTLLTLIEKFFARYKQWRNSKWWILFRWTASTVRRVRARMFLKNELLLLLFFVCLVCVSCVCVSTIQKYLYLYILINLTYIYIIFFSWNTLFFYFYSTFLCLDHSTYLYIYTH